MNSRYYDPEIGRFINADGYASTGQGILGNNMFAYCGNNPISRSDSTGQFWSELLEFAKTAISEIGKAMSVMSPAYAGCGGFAMADGPLLIGDAIGAIGSIVITLGAAGYGIYQATKTPASTKSKAGNTIIDTLEKYGIGQCKEAAAAVQAELIKNKQHGAIITIQYPGIKNRNYVWSDIAQRTISENGFHCGIMYDGKVYCNIHPYGLPEEAWINDFHGLGIPVIQYVPF